MEYIKYAPKELHKEIAVFLSETAETGEDLLELAAGMYLHRLSQGT